MTQDEEEYQPKYVLKPNDRYGKRKHLWQTGPDVITHDMYYGWLKHRAQAHYRNEGHDLTWPEWEAIWKNNNNWSKRGRSVTDICLVRINSRESWNLSNVELVNRREQLHRQAASRAELGMTYTRRKKK